MPSRKFSRHRLWHKLLAVGAEPAATDGTGGDQFFLGRTGFGKIVCTRPKSADFAESIRLPKPVLLGLFVISVRNH